jgi:hypothetical protein
MMWGKRSAIPAAAFVLGSCAVHSGRNVTPPPLTEVTTSPLATVAAPPSPPAVSLSGASETCVTQPVEFTITVQNPPADNGITLYVNGKELLSDRLMNGGYKFAFTGAQAPGTYEVKAVSGGVSAATSVQVKPCLPTCGITLSPLPAKAGKPFNVDVSGSLVAAGVRGGIKSAKVEVVDSRGVVVGTYDLAAPSLVKNALVIEKSGIHTIRAVVVDEAGQTSASTCSAQVDVRGVTRTLTSTSSESTAPAAKAASHSPLAAFGRGNLLWSPPPPRSNVG